MLLIDSHEPKEIIEKIKEAIPAQVLRLKYGDYSFSDISIERKTLSDFFKLSIISKLMCSFFIPIPIKCNIILIRKRV